MAKECLCCGKKIGLLAGEHFDGKMCDNCYSKYGGYRLLSIEGTGDCQEYINCFEDIEKLIEEQEEIVQVKEKAKELFFQEITSRYKVVTGYDLKQKLDEHYANKERELQRLIANEKKELQHIDYANSFKEFYEYDVETIINEEHGMVDKEKMKQILTDYSRKGYGLHTIYSNELGKNALSVLGFGVNSTACEDVMIFERRVKELDEE